MTCGDTISYWLESDNAPQVYRNGIFLNSVITTDCAYERASEAQLSDARATRALGLMRRSVSMVPKSVAVWWHPAEGITVGASVSHWKRSAVGTLVSIF